MTETVNRECKAVLETLDFRAIYSTDEIESERLVKSLANRIQSIFLEKSCLCITGEEEGLKIQRILHLAVHSVDLTPLVQDFLLQQSLERIELVYPDTLRSIWGHMGENLWIAHKEMSMNSCTRLKDQVPLNDTYVIGFNNPVAPCVSFNCCNINPVSLLLTLESKESSWDGSDPLVVCNLVHRVRHALPPRGQDSMKYVHSDFGVIEELSL